MFKRAQKIVALIQTKYFVTGGYYVARVGKEWVFGHRSHSSVTVLKRGWLAKFARMSRDLVGGAYVVNHSAIGRGVSPAEIDKAMQFLKSS